MMEVKETKEKGNGRGSDGGKGGRVRGGTRSSQLRVSADCNKRNVLP